MDIFWSKATNVSGVFLYHKMNDHTYMEKFYTDDTQSFESYLCRLSIVVTVA